jgi:hypothetical protein
LAREAIDYEQLRSRAQGVGFAQGYTFLPCGLAAWLCAAPAMTGPRNSAATSALSSTATLRSPLSTTLASIVLRLTKEAAHA